MRAVAISAPGRDAVGRVFNLQRCSVHDGPGIRTTVFFKGCPLACAWCHNPEGIRAAAELMLHVGRCLSCGACSEACPIDDGGAAPVGEPWNPDACTRCGACVEACPADAREMAGRDYTAGELAELLQRDRPFFEASGGGVTFSGGEPLGQPEFLVACLRACRERGLHTAVDTCGVAARDTVLEVAGLADLVLFDLKLMDRVAHRRYTGVDHQLILDNLRAISSGETEVWVRLPLIPCVNDDNTELDAFGSFLATLPRRHRVFVLPYHGIASGKTTRLAGRSSVPVFAAPTEEGLVAARARLEAFGLEVSIGGSP